MHSEGWFDMADDEFEKHVNSYTFEYSFDVKSTKRVTFISAPAGSKHVETEGGFTVSMPATDKPPKRDLRLFYKTEDMMYP